jgi:hypothetical protein
MDVGIFQKVEDLDLENRKLREEVNMLRRQHQLLEQRVRALE